MGVRTQKEFIRRVCDGETVVYADAHKTRPRTFRRTVYCPVRGFGIHWDFNSSGFERWVYVDGRFHSHIKGVYWWYELLSPRSGTCVMGDR